MESVLTLIFSAENIRMLVLLAFGCSGYVLINSKIGRVENTLNRRIDGVEASIGELKHNDFAHLQSDFAHLQGAFEALIFTLERSSNLSSDDKEYISRTLSR